MKILIAEDNYTDRLILSTIIKNQGHTVIEAADGDEALHKAIDDKPDLVLLDAIMPEKDGFEVATELKNHYIDSYIPIVFITSLTDADSLVRCIESGGDDFFTKPFNKVILEAKISAFQRTIELYQTVQQQRDELTYFTQHLQQEQHVAKRIFDNIAHKGALDSSFIKYMVSPMSIFNGDILLAAPKPLGGINVFLGDFTGHGLPASIGALPASDIFFGMTAKGFELYEIVKELNNKLNNILPTGFFCCAAFAEIDFDENSIRFWNGGLPESHILSKSEGKIIDLPSKHLPLGILPTEQLKIEIDLLTFNKGDSLFLYSDGVIEAENANGQMFGKANAMAALKQGLISGSAFDQLTRSIAEFQTVSEQANDITYIEIENHERQISQSVANKIPDKLIKEGPSDSKFSLLLGPESLRQFNPLPTLSQHLFEIGNLRSYRTQIMTILTEMYSNSLEHGVLGLDSELKQDARGFAEYYQQREQRLTNLADGFVKIKLDHTIAETGGRLFIKMSDSGSGFDFQSLQAKMMQGELKGRGYPLIAKLADSIEFSDNGSSVEVIFTWKLKE
ncbi:MAG: SpoIIE family protein phosphatase [Kangiellaceae bacterium]|nr:SpoIIE family protein phosphatase [Kangiellaceae bacterium]